MKKDAVISYIRRSLVMLPAVPFVSLAVVLILFAGLGNDAFTSFQQGVSIQLGISVGTASLYCNLAVLALFLILDRKLIGSGSVIMSFCLGPIIDIWSNLLLPYIPAEPEIWLRGVLLAVGMLILVFSLSWYIPLNVGLQATDLISMYLGKLLHITIGTGLLIFNIVAFALGFIMGADWGVGTLVTVFLTGKLIDIFLPISGRMACKLAGMPFNDVNAEAKAAKK